MDSNKRVSSLEVTDLLEELLRKLESGDIQQAEVEVNRLIDHFSKKEHCIDSTYIASVKSRKRKTTIDAIVALLHDMNDEQLENVRVYAVDEYNEPNHEATALNAIIQLSKEAEGRQSK